MSATLTIRDETAGGQPLHEWALEVLTERMSVRELIRSRVYQEVQDYNQSQPDRFIADGMSENLQPTFIELRDGRLILCRIPEQFSAQRGIVAVGRKHSCRMSFHHSVQHGLHYAA